MRFIRCQTCGSWCQSPQVVPASLAAWYDSDDYQGSTERAGAAYVNYVDDEAGRLTEARRRYCRDLVPYLPQRGARVLEIGCATGSLLAVVRASGHDVVGVDLSRRFAEAAGTLHRVDVHVGDVMSVDLTEGHFDMVLLFGTVSNLSDIPGVLQRVRRLLKSRGTLILNYPTADSMIARAYGARFWMFAPSVNTFMTERGCRAALTRAGLTVVRSQVDRQMPSFRKLLKHARLSGLLRLLDIVGLGRAFLPIPLPFPGVRIIWARAE